MTDDEVSVSITFNVTNEYVWEGPVKDLPEDVRKNVIGKSGELNEDTLTNNIESETDINLGKLVSDATLQADEFELVEVLEI